MTDLLQQGIAAARAGQRAEARALLMSVVETDERNEQAWLWLAGVVDDPDDVRTCLQNVLDLNPANQHAKQGLAWIESRNGSSASSESVAAPAAPASSAAAAAPTRSEPAASASSQPVSEPVVPASNTGPTTNLASVVAPAPPARPVVAASAAAPDTLPTERPEHPCPYCGVPTVLSQHACTQCKGDLMVRTAARTTSSVPLKILGGLWVANGVFSIIGSLLGAVGALLIFQQMQSMAVSINPKASVPFPTIILIPIVIGLLFGFGIIKVARALMRRERWAYYIIIALSALGFIVTLINVAQVGTMLRELVTPGAVLLPASQQSMVTRIVAVAGAAAFCTLAFQALYLALIGLCYRDFFGPMVRFSPVVESAEHVQHYNNGIAYKNRGMWYMATQEWEAALKKQPLDTNYLLALGLAYAQLKRLYPRSIAFYAGTHDYLLSRKAELYTVAPDLEQINLL